jgi:hypothetical protein
VKLALVLGTASILPVAWWLRQPPDWELEPGGWQEITIVQALVLALAAVIPAALAGSLLAGRLVRQHPAIAAFVAMTVSWWIGIGMLPLAAGALGIPLTAGLFCIDGCTAFLDYQEPFLGFTAFPISLIWTVVLWPYLAVPLVLGIVALVVRRRFVTILFAIALHSGLSVGSIALGGFLPYVCLAAGVLVWSVWLAEPAEGRAMAADTEAVPVESPAG